MALRPIRPRVFLSRVHFLIRFLGLTGVLVAVVGLFLAYQQFLLASWETARATAEDALHGILPGDSASRLAVFLTMGGAAAAAFALLVEILLLLRFAAGRRSLSGLNATVQVGLAAALFLAVNVWAFNYSARQDWTRDQLFTLPAEDRAALTKLDRETTIIVFQRKSTFGRLSSEEDSWENAAETKVVEKVRDLVDQMRALGPKFKVEVLNKKDLDFQDKLTALTENRPELRRALDEAPEDSIFFYAKDDKDRERIQRLSFNAFYLLDKTASAEDNGGRGNLVLLNQGVKPFVAKVLNLEEKRPKVGVLVIHEWLATTGGGPDELTMAGLRKSLTSYGFDVKDVILKKWDDVGPPKPDAFTFEENKLNRLEAEKKDAEQEKQTYQAERDELTRMLRDWESMSLEDLTKKYAAQFRVKEVTANVRRQLMPVLRLNLQLREEGLKEKEAELKEIEKGLKGLDREKAAEAGRMPLRDKMARQLADCDLLIVPRMTLRNVAIGDLIPSRLYRLDQAQADAVRDFLKTGRPVFACFGPVNDPRERLQPLDPAEAGPDPLESALERLGLRFGRQTVLFNVESKAFAERRTGLPTSGAVKVPTVIFDWPTAALSRSPAEQASGELKPNRIRESMRILARGVGKDVERKPEETRLETDVAGEQAAGSEGKLDLRLRHPRPIYYEPRRGEALAYDPVFMTTDPASWNDDQPFPTRERTPHFEPAKDDPNKGTFDEKRRGPFPIGVAVEAPLPVDWRASDGSGPATVRVAALGHGGLFVGPELTPAKEKLLVNVCNWLLGRDDVLPREDVKWSYPRVVQDERENTLWQWGARLGLPVLFLYLGLVVLLVRRVR
jgi:hypothetical protein